MSLVKRIDSFPSLRHHSHTSRDVRMAADRDGIISNGELGRRAINGSDARRLELLRHASLDFLDVPGPKAP